MYLLYNFLEDLIINVREELVQFEEADPVLVLLQEPDHVRLRPSFNKVLVRSALGIINLHVRLRLYLAHQVHLLYLPHKDLVLAVLVLMHDAQEVVPLRLVVEDRAVVHVVLQHSHPLVVFNVDLAQQGYFFTFLLQHLPTIGPHMFQSHVFRFFSECDLLQNFVRVDKPLKFRSHAEVVNE